MSFLNFSFSVIGSAPKNGLTIASKNEKRNNDEITIFSNDEKARSGKKALDAQEGIKKNKEFIAKKDRAIGYGMKSFVLTASVVNKDGSITDCYEATMQGKRSCYNF